MALDVDRVSADGVWYRHLPHRGRVWWRSEPAPDGRWQRGSEVAGFYLANSRDTAWAEWHRQIEGLALRPEDQLPRDLWRFEVDIEAIVDLRSEEQLARVGLTLPTPKRREWPAFQAVGEQLRSEGWKGLRAPSAATPDEGEILCLFRGAEKIDGVKPLPPGHSQTPTATTAGIDSQPPWPSAFRGSSQHQITPKHQLPISTFASGLRVNRA